VPAGSVISQNPTGGTSAVCDSEVDLVISDGPCVVADWLGINSSHIDSKCGEAAGATLADALDGIDFWAHYVTESPHWFIIDLGASYNVQEVKGRSNYLADPIDVNIYVSDDKGDFGTAVATGISTWQNTDNWVEIDTTDKTGRYVKVEIVAVDDVDGHIIFGGWNPSFKIFDVYAAPAGP
jgi:hypothetical protein